MATVGDLFDVRYGHSMELNRLKLTDSERGIAFVSRKMGDNGVSAFVEAMDAVAPAAPGELSVALGGNGVLSTFLQERPFYTGRDVAILAPKEHLNKAAILYYCMCIKANRYRYSYGRQANRTLRYIVVPSPKELPKWVYVADIERFLGADQSATTASVLLSDTNDWKAYRIGDLFDVRKGKRLNKSSMTPGNTPFISALDNSNELSGFVGQPAIHQGNTITVNYDGNGVGIAFYQPDPFWCADSVNVLYPKISLTPAIALFIAGVIRL